MSKNPGVYTALQSAVKLSNRISSSSSCISGTARLIICEISLFVTAAKRENLTRVTSNLREFGVARPEELEVSQWIALDIPTLSSQSEGAKNTVHCFSMY